MSEEIGQADYVQGLTHGLARAQAQRGLDMLDCEIGLAGPELEKAAHIPAAGEARVQRERPVDQPDHRTDILAECSQHSGGVGEDARIAIVARAITSQVVPSDLPYRNPEHRELYLSGLRLAAGEAP